jgi:uncharacterized membrane protein (DUF2068 family)
MTRSKSKVADAQPIVDAPGTLAAPAGHDRGLLAIAIFKFAKFAGLTALGIGALQMLRPEVALGAENWATELALSDERKVLQFALGKANAMSEARLRAVGIGCFIYAAIFLVEGVGLYFEKRWAEYLTIVATGSLILIELYGLAHGVTVGKVALLIVNLVIVGYLAFRLKHQRLAHESK